MVACPGWVVDAVALRTKEEVAGHGTMEEDEMAEGVGEVDEM